MSSYRFALGPGNFPSETDSRLGSIAAFLDAENCAFILALRDEWRQLALSPEELRALRDRAIRDLAAGHYADLPSVHRRAQALASDLARETAMRADAVPGSKRERLREVLQLNGGSPLSWRTITDVLAP